MATTRETELTFDSLLSQDWIQEDLRESTVSRTEDGEIILWTKREAYRVSGRRITRLFIPKSEDVIL